MVVIDRSACVVPPGGMCRPPIVFKRFYSESAYEWHYGVNPVIRLKVNPLNRPLTFVVRGDGYPCAGGSWSQLSVGLLNHGLKARTSAFLWVIGMAVTGGKDMVAVGQIWAQVLQVCSLHFCVHKLFIIRAFIIREMPS